MRSMLLHEALGGQASLNRESLIGVAAGALVDFARFGYGTQKSGIGHAFASNSRNEAHWQLPRTSVFRIVASGRP
jgi:hypothetical protein